MWCPSDEEKQSTHHHKLEASRPQSNALRFPEGPCEIEDRFVTALLGGRLALLFLHMAFQTILGLDSSYLFTTSFYFSISFLFKYVMQRMTRHVLFNQPVRSESVQRFILIVNQ